MKSNFSMSPMLQLHLGVALLGVSGLFAKLIDLSALDIIAYRGLFTAVCLGLFLWVTKSTLKLNNKKDYLVAVILGILAALHWLTYFISIQYTTVAIGMISMFTYPVMVVILEPLIYGRRPSKTDIIISVLVLFAISLLFPNIWLDSVVVDDQFVVGVLAGLFSALCFALRNIGIQHHFKGYSGTQGMFYQFLVTAIIFLPFSDTTPLELEMNNIQLLIVFAIFFSAMAHVLFASSINVTGAKTAGLVACLQPLYGVILSMFILAEVPNMMTLIGGLIIISAAIFETTQGHKKSKV
ncbi:DMT family transporter [Psychrosphaera sp. B3R10]|uniref:DMT family transporter n=1 Tax=unclassified Psychrosphaera TaxID=2641570 RepID=UPI001C097E22|nr:MULTISPECIES: DMT family transporter [unclassified Psychrosphaera]MBU2882617.1 DMT family transporter [Psychrosphaera sp. I2R16]MBU2989364.1 DMT family transporter [Psychrosphaera sp. B3R10]